jgi:hypothetical protein
MALGARAFDILRLMIVGRHDARCLFGAPPRPGGPVSPPRLDERALRTLLYGQLLPSTAVSFAAAPAVLVAMSRCSPVVRANAARRGSACRPCATD